MRTHGWGGSVPRDDAEAVSRILDAAKRALDRSGRDMSLTDVARDLGVTRQTVYRYFPSAEELIVATANHATEPFLARLVLKLRGIHDPATACVESLAYVIEQLPHEPYLQIALSPGTPSSRAAWVTSPQAVAQAAALFGSFDVDWPAHGYDESMLREIVSHLLRLLQSLLVDPGGVELRGVELRDYLWRWLAPAIRELPDRLGPERAGLDATTTGARR